MNNQEVREKVLSGFRLTPPEICSIEIQKVMIKCWELDPHNRPTFNVIFSFI